MRKHTIAVVIVVTLFSSIERSHAWGAQGHRLVGLIAAGRLTPVARQQVAWLLDGQSLADVASWADTFTSEQVQTSVLALPEHPAGGERLRSRSRLPEAARHECGQPRRSLARLRRRSDRILGRASRRPQARSRRSRDRAEVHRAFHWRSAPAIPRAWRRTRRQRRERAGVWTGRLRPFDPSRASGSSRAGSRDDKLRAAPRGVEGRQRSNASITMQSTLGVG